MHVALTGVHMYLFIYLFHRLSCFYPFSPYQVTIIRVLLKGAQLHNQATFIQSSPSTTFANFIAALTSITTLPTATISL